MCKFFCMIFLCVILFSGCGVPDRALVLSGEQAQELQETGQASEIGTSSVAYETPMNSSGPDGTANGKQGNLPDEAEDLILVYVCGAVVNPGVVELPAGSRAADALEAAGGLLAGARTDYVNLAARLEDAQKLYFPTEEEADELIREETAAASGIININTAGVEQLCTLPGIGEARANDIITYRKEHGLFEREEDIMQVAGIKESSYAKLKGKITVK